MVNKGSLGREEKLITFLDTDEVELLKYIRTERALYDPLGRTQLADLDAADDQQEQQRLQARLMQIMGWHSRETMQIYDHTFSVQEAVQKLHSFQREAESRALAAAREPFSPERVQPCERTCGQRREASTPLPTLAASRPKVACVPGPEYPSLMPYRDPVHPHTRRSATDRLTSFCAWFGDWDKAVPSWMGLQQ